MSYSNLINFQNYTSGSAINTDLITYTGTVNAPASQTEYTVSSIQFSRHKGRFVVVDVRYRLVSQVAASASDRNYRMRGSSTANTIHTDTSAVTWNGALNTIPGYWWVPTLATGPSPYFLPGDNPLIRDGLSSLSATSYIISVMITGFYTGRT